MEKIKYTPPTNSTFHPEAESLREEIQQKQNGQAIVVIDRTIPLKGDIAAHLTHEFTKQGYLGLGHPIDVVLRDIMATPDIPTFTEPKGPRLGHAALAENVVYHPKGVTSERKK